MPGSAISVGDLVEMRIPDSARTAGFLWLLVLPVALFFIGYLGIAALVHGASEGTQALAGLAGLALGLGAATLATRKGRLAARPSVVAISEF